MNIKQIVTSTIISTLLSFNLFSAEYRVLNIPGGGAAGMITLTVLAELERDTGKQVYQLFDEIWGASIGSLIAALLTTNKIGEDQPMTAEELLMLLKEDVFGGYFPVAPKMIGYTQALGIFNFVKCHLGHDAKMSDTRIPVRILVGEVNSYKYSCLTGSVTHQEISSYDDNAAEISLSDTVSASCNILGFIYPFTQNIEGIDETRCFIDSGMRCKMNPVSMFHIENKPNTTLYFIGNGWINRVEGTNYGFDKVYSVSFDLQTVFTDWQKQTYTGMALVKLIGYNYNLIGCGFIPYERLILCNDEKAKNEYQELLRNLISSQTN